MTPEVLYGAPMNLDGVFSRRIRVLGVAALASGFLIVGACKSSGTKPPSTPPPAPKPAPAAQPTPAPTTTPANPPAANPPAAPASANAAVATGAAGAGGGRGRGGNPPPPVPPVPTPMPAPVTPIVGTMAPTPDPRVGLKAGYWDAAQAAWNVKL